MTITHSLATVVDNYEIKDIKKCKQIAGDFDCHADAAVQCITQWSTSMAFLEATGCCHWASVCAILPWQPPWLTIMAANKKSLTQHNFH
jgi:hypothetical protein